MDRTRPYRDGLRRSLLSWPPIVVVVAPLISSIAVTALIDATSGSIGTAAVPFVLAAYFLGVAVWAMMQIILPRRLCFMTAVAAAIVCASGAIQGSNLLAWLLISAIGGLIVTAPALWRDAEVHQDSP